MMIQLPAGFEQSDVPLWPSLIAPGALFVIGLTAAAWRFIRYERRRLRDLPPATWSEAMQAPEVKR